MSFRENRFPLLRIMRKPEVQASVPHSGEDSMSRSGRRGGRHHGWTLRTMAALGGTALMIASALASAAQTNYPSRPIRLVVGFPPGGGVDVVARLFADKLTASLGQSVVVENRPGASGSIAGRQVAGAEPDGHTVLVNSNSMVVNQIMSPATGLNVERDLVAILSVAPQSIILAAAPDLPVGSLGELIALARTRKLLYGSPGVGSVPHLLVEYLFTSLANVRLDHVPYQGAANALTAAMTSQIQLATVTTPPAVALVKAGKVKGVVVTSVARSSALPDVPTVAESGYPGFVINVWSGFFMPANTPRPVIERFHKAALEVANMPDIKEKLAGLGFDTTTTSTDQFARDVSEEVKRWSDVVQKAKLKAQ
jgi:tripartite-type tricarboxylate transporter receptor subunit TctC